MALTTEAFQGKPVETEADPEYEVITEADGKKALKKIRNDKELKVQTVPAKVSKNAKSKKGEE